jgi:hypothetical protein
VIAALAAAAAAYGAYVATTWVRFGRPAAPRDPDDTDKLLERLMPRYDVVERHRITVAAPAAMTLEAARTMDLGSTPVVRAIFRARELVMGAERSQGGPSRGFVADMEALGWGTLAIEPDREIVMGGVTKPWEPNPVFRALPPDEFQAFTEPDFVKIVFTLRADPAGEDRSVFRTETRAVATDVRARGKFRWYWALLSPGIILIRRAMLLPVKSDAERRAKAARAKAAAPVL